ncbi:helix-turn-helix transcriptional regulator [Nonomuraea rubra]|uniref:DNA-binding CsgD family transcriptional regulator n=1 Tax=Nonomuraea rubra TaxID=46180 RepID=A0A7X0NYD9_9ACTN|nr:LuxR family transcriptional regulator [Nonomuraea rubra]MBB6551928.1 DNA-binding CsgD family transcriptional regulator [Nonomuraea rubra]
MFVGRTAELASLRAELRAAGGGSVRRAVVEGPEGIGKTALIRHALDGEAGVRVLAVSGEESERELGLGVVRQLMDEAALLGLGLGLGTDERAGGGSAAAFPQDAARGGGIRAADEADSCAAGQAVCELVARSPVPGTLAVVVDDAQWADRASLGALSYVLRHVRAGRVLLLVACRDLADPWLPDGLRRQLAGDGTLLITLGGLSAGDLAELATDPALTAARRERGTYGSPADAAREALAALRSDASRWGAAARRLREHTLGNPLHARALLAVLAPAVLADPGVRLPAPETYRRPFARRLHACAPATRRLVAACAVLGGSCPLHVAAAVATGIDEPLNTLEEAVTAGLLRELPGRLIDFPEPLARAAAYDGIGAGARARLHLAAARLADDDGAALRHRAAAADGPDEALAEELARFAAKAAQHGLWQEAAAHLELAAGLTQSPARRDELRTAVLEHVLIGGDVIRAAELAAVRNADPRPVRRYVLGRLALAAGRFDDASELLAEAWRHAEPGFAADVAEQLSWLRLVTGDRAEAANWARLSAGQPIAGPVARPYDVLALGGASGAGAPPGSLAEAVAHLERDEAGQACAVLKRAVTAAEAAGLPHHRLLATALLSVAEHGLARWDEAVAHAEAALAEAYALGQRWLLPWLEAACVAPLAARGDRERALAHATAAGVAARRMRHAAGEHQADLAMALLGAGDLPARPGAGALPDGRWSGASDLADGRFCAGTGGVVPDPRPARIEALVADGRLEEAERVLAAYERAGPSSRPDGGQSSGHSGGDGCGHSGGDGCGHSGGDGCGHSGGPGDGQSGGPGGGRRWEAERVRLEGLLLAARNVPTRAEEAFGRALELAGAGGCPLEEARALLDLGRLLRRTGRRRAAAERLGAARAIFDRLGARPLVERCAQELEACGLEPPATVRLGLTPQELSTATLVAGGLTNRQIARELLISVKTVEYHIGKIYTKLGIGSRVALAAKLAAYGPEVSFPAGEPG